MRTLLCALLLGCQLTLAAEGRPFVISSTSLPAEPPPAQTSPSGEPVAPPSEAGIIDRLKQMVVLDYLRSALGNRFSEYASQATIEFAEGYILDYKVTRKEVAGQTANPALELSGHLDVEGLNRFIRLNETKARGSASLRPVFVMSSEVPGLNLVPGNSGATARTSVLGQTFFGDISKVFRKFNTELGLVADRRLLLTAPAENPSQMSDLRDYAGIGGFNSAVWVHLQTCRSPGCGMRAEIHTYNLSQGRRLFVHAGPLKISTADLADGAKVQAAVDPLVKEYAARFEESVSKGTLFSTSYRLVVRNIDQYRSYKKLKAGLSKLEYLVQSVPKRVRSNEAEFQVLSPLSAQELGQRLQMTAFPGFQLAATATGSALVEMRYVNRSGG